MDVYLNLTEDEQIIYCEQAGATLGLPAASVEKDFWVTWTLGELFSLPEWGEHLSFKGGTSLSKAWKLIQRFSEDVDIVIDRAYLGFEKELSVNQQTRLKAECSRRIHAELLPTLLARFAKRIPEGRIWQLKAAPIEEDSDQQTLVFEYPGVLSQTVTYLRPVVKIEMGARSDTDPSERPIIRPYLCETFPEQLGDGGFAIQTVSALRTFWDKVLILHEDRMRPTEKARNKPMARHYYDVWALVRAGIGDKALEDTELFDRVVRHRRIFFRYGWMDYDTMRLGTLNLIPTEHRLSGWRNDYRGMSAEMFFGDVPSFDDILSTVREFEDRANDAVITEGDG